MNLTIFFATVFAFSLHGSIGNPTESVFKAFSKTFPQAKNVSWSDESNSYRAAFQQNGVQFRVNYDKKGNIISTTRYYNEENLPVMILAKINKKFADKKVFGVVEQASQDGTIIYHIILEGTEDWIHVTGDSAGTLTVDETFKKA
jgi:hypothetical protein